MRLGRNAAADRRTHDLVQQPAQHRGKTPVGIGDGAVGRQRQRTSGHVLDQRPVSAVGTFEIVYPAAVAAAAIAVIAAIAAIAAVAARQVACDEQRINLAVPNGGQRLCGLRSFQLEGCVCTASGGRQRRQCRSWRW